MMVINYVYNIGSQLYTGRVGPVVARSTVDREVRGSNPTLA